MLETFPIVPASSKWLWIINAIVLVVLVGAGTIMMRTAIGARASRFELRDDGLRLRGDLYGRTIPYGAMDGSAARVVDLEAERDLAPRTRTMGTAVPGYAAGWFRLRNGEKALLYLTDRAHAVYVPTSLGYSLLLSPADPERFVARLRARLPDESRGAAG